MRIVEGFEAAREALSRLLPFFESELEPQVRDIIRAVRAGGDNAMREYTRRFEGIQLGSLEVNREEIKESYRKIDAALLSALKLAAGRVRDFHLAQKKRLYTHLSRSGAGQIVRPLGRAGIYAPGGSAYYPSTVLMTAIPAKVAGVGEIILTTPPGVGGKVPVATLAAADIAGVDRVFSVGGAQAIAALAFGTETIPSVDKICGPGGIFVALAKKLVFGTVDIDGIQGPSEIMIIADETAKPGFCAADMLAQAEHDRLASSVLVTTSRKLAGLVDDEMERQLDGLPRQEIAREALKSRGLIAIVASMQEAVALANLYAPEHLALMVAHPESYPERITGAGCIFLGGDSTVVLGDYVAGPSHALPTGGTARYGSPLSVVDFLKITDIVNIDRESLKQLGSAAAIIARAEGLEAHARAVEKRYEGG